MWHKTPVTELLKIKYPIIQGPFGGRFSSVKLVAKVSELGGLGSFGLNAYGPDEILSINREIVQKTSNPYVLNLWVPLKHDPVNQFDEASFEKLKANFKPYFDQHNVPLPDTYKKSGQNFDLQVEALLEAEPPVVSFIYGIPAQEIIQAFKEKNTVLMAVATTKEEALDIEQAGIDVVIASGMEAGGHRASFLKAADDSLTSTRTLVHQIRNAVNLPVIAAGGISNGRDIHQMLRLGAGAAQLGTAFLATRESNASEEHRSRLLATTGFDTQLTRVFSGRLARVIRSDFALSVGENNAIAPYPIQSNFLKPLLHQARWKELQDFEAFWSGQPTTTLVHETVDNLFQSLLLEIQDNN